MGKYNHKILEKKWQEKWDKDEVYKVGEDKNKEKYYILDMFPYPSGAGLHVGHPKGYIATDIFARSKMMQGYNVLHPMGWDAFGLPAENFAIKNKMHPQAMNEQNIANFKSQLGKLGFTYDWDREINTTDPEFYKWTQWIFLQMFKRGLAYESNEPIIWCPSCQTGLANEDLEDGRCERCDSEIERKPMRQWVLKITDYADRMLEDLEKLPNWEDSIKEMQKNWIGRSEGAHVDFKVQGSDLPEKVYLGTTNENKIERFSKLFNKVYPNIKVEAVPEVIDVEETAELAVENAIDKVKVYEGKYEYPVISGDTAVFIDGEDFDPTHVKRVVLKGEDEAKFSKEEICQKMVDFYKEIARKNGGEKDFEYEDAWAIIFPDGKIKTNVYRRKYILTTEEKGERMIKFPMRNLYKSKETGKYTIEHNDEEFFKEFTCQMDAIEDLMGDKLTVFTTRPDTLFGCTYMVVAPEHELVSSAKVKNRDEVDAYVKKAQNKSDLERTDLNKDKTGVKLEGLSAINPVNGKEVPIFVADYVLSGYGTGAIMAVPAHDERDWEFATAHNMEHVTHNINIKPVVKPCSIKETSVFAAPKILEGENIEKATERIKNKNYEQIIKGEKVFVGEGVAINSDFLNGLKTQEAKSKMIEWLEERNLGTKAINYKLQDWVFSRQRYWGEPIPIIHCDECGAVAVPEEELPVELPKVESYEPTGTGESPLANITEWVNTKCPKCGKDAKRETNTMPQWAGSSWYYLRFVDPHNDKALIDKDLDKYWSPVDFYVGGAEHATRHLIYARFWHKFLYDIGVVNYDEPFTRLQHVGLIMAEDGRKMSKRWGNVINPDDVVEEFGADAMRVYEMFMGPFSQSCSWSTSGITGSRKFLEKVYNLVEKCDKDCPKDKKIESLLHKTIKKTGEDIEEFKFNTAISQMMILANEMIAQEKINLDDYKIFIKILSPFAPYLTQEIWESLGEEGYLIQKDWPKYDEALIKDETINLAIQVNGKLRDTIEVPADISEDEAKDQALASDRIKRWIEGKEIRKVIFIKGRLINIVV